MIRKLLPLKQIGYMRNMEETNTTIRYYNRNADKYFNNTVNVDMSECCDRFLKYVVPGGKIIDIGAGSGRDIKYFKDRGYTVDGIDASEEMCRLASSYAGVDVRCVRIQDWYPKRKYDGIWANASMLHLQLTEFEEFACRVSDYLNPNGVFYISMKKGIQTGQDSNGRFFTDFSEEKVQQIVAKSTAFVLVESWETRDGLRREGFRWLNLIFKSARNRTFVRNSTF